MSDQLKEWADQRANFESNRLILKEKISEELCVVYNGGLFKSTPELIAFLSVMDDEELCLEDSYGNPIIVDRRQFLEKLKQAYRAAMNSYHIEYQNIKQARKGKNL